ncbi:EAL and HDOD domain-containing protein [Thauera sinica]|uniref:EAL and HDOD domain-containing protein n=1 Tax=Thauera sinica TaxID=2665146 RepID=A0ABW1AMS8_9RHOO|nr:HDOD domain-containing protein [Thauera sp. K11]ATE60649.1 signal transduction protein [Thauera sp. K11]
MLKAILDWLFGRRRRPATATAGRSPAPVPPRDSDPAGFQTLNRTAPLRSEGDAAPAELDASTVFVCREAVLGRDQRIAGYQFMLQEGTRNRIRHSSRRVHHLYAEVLVRNLARADIGTLIGRRFAFIDVPDSFLEHPCLTGLPPHKTVLVLGTHPDPGAPGIDALRETIGRLRVTGVRIALPDPTVVREFEPLLPQADFVMLRAPALDARRSLQLASQVVEAAPQARLLVRDLPGLEDFRFCFKLGASLFQGPFITSRENWDDRDLGPNTARLTRLIGKVRTDADTSELAGLLKEDAALSLRLLRYINAASNGLAEYVSSIERAVVVIGREKLYRWLILLVCGTDGRSGRSSAALESALVRARMLELLGAERESAEREALFLTGLLSLIDVILEVPMEKAIAPLALPPEIELAVRHGEGPYAPLLELAIACEQFNAERIVSAASRCGVPPHTASERHLKALSWAVAIGE